MNFPVLLSAYLNLNFLILFGMSGLFLFSIFLKKWNKAFEAKAELKLHYCVLIGVLFFSVIQPMLPQNKTFSPIAKVWSSNSIKGFTQFEIDQFHQEGYLSLSSLSEKPTMMIKASHLMKLGSILFGILFLFAIIFVFLGFYRLFKIKKNSFLDRRIGAVQIFVNDAVDIPFSYWVPGQVNVFIPSYLICRRENYKIALLHELQHHRQGDTFWVYVLGFLKLICFINPSIYFWNRWISEIQEFACDEVLVDQKKVKSQAYASCLLEVVQTAINRRPVSVSATGIMFLIKRNLLKRRIEKMIKNSSNKLKQSFRFSVGLGLVSMMAIATFASKGWIQDRRITMEQAQVMAERFRHEAGIPIVVNDLVLTQLNRYIGTPEGRAHMRASLLRMDNFKETIQGHLQQYNLPNELLAVPLIESGYQNLAANKNPVKAAGLWQFIPPTARNFGLRVDEFKDERLDVELSTDAALRYLKINHLRFKDWGLSFLSYYIGESAVQNGINEIGSRDPWVLVRKGKGDSYLPKLMAAILIMNNPESVD